MILDLFGSAFGAVRIPWLRHCSKSVRVEARHPWRSSSRRSGFTPYPIRTMRGHGFAANFHGADVYRRAICPGMERIHYYATWTQHQRGWILSFGEGADVSEVTNEWLQTNIRNKGPLGRRYPRFAFIMEGDTPSVLGLIDNGLNAYRRPDWGGWGGRYVYRQPGRWRNPSDLDARRRPLLQSHVAGHGDGHGWANACIGPGDHLEVARRLSK